MSVTIPPKEAGDLVQYAPGLLPILPGGDDAFVKRELARLATAISEVALMTPQTAYKEPSRKKDGMTRLTRKPWFPVSGQTTDKWVYWDAAGQAWRYSSTDPTSIT